VILPRIQHSAVIPGQTAAINGAHVPAFRGGLVTKNADLFRKDGKRAILLDFTAWLFGALSDYQ
jgi:hypothetical protein